MQYDPTPLTEKKIDGFMSFLTNEPFLVKAEGFTPVTLSFADNGLPLVAETFVVLQETIDTERDMLKAFLKAEIRGWTDAVADPAGRPSSPSRTTARTSGLTPRPDRAGHRAERADRHRRHQGQRPVHDDRRAAGREHRRAGASASRSPPRSCSTSAARRGLRGEAGPEGLSGPDRRRRRRMTETGTTRGSAAPVGATGPARR